jgi:hypothetical protein
VELFVTGGDGEALRDNRRLMKAVGRHAAPSTATAFMVVKPDACWTCATCYCTNARAAAACADYRKQRPSTARQTDALRQAAEAGDVAAAVVLIAAAVPLDTAPQGWTALMYASNKGHTVVVQALLAAGAGTAAQCQGGSNALFLASGTGHLEAQALLAAGAGTAAPVMARFQFADGEAAEGDARSGCGEARHSGVSVRHEGTVRMPRRCEGRECYFGGRLQRTQCDGGELAARLLRHVGR